MLAHSDTNIEDVASLILEKNYDVAFLVPTRTGLEKGYCDAHQSIRALFNKTQYHNYENQEQANIRKVTAYFLTSENTFENTVSLYRPKSKNGDPRIGIYGLKKLVRANNLIALIVIKQELFIINCSDNASLNHALEVSLPKIEVVASNIANELLNKLIKISNKGFIRTLTGEDNGVGLTLENQLGIRPNSSQKPDYKGIELKTTRVSKTLKQKNKHDLFGRVPNWNISPLKSTTDILNKRGYIDKKGRFAYRNTISSKPNSHGLYFEIDYVNEHLKQMFRDIAVKDFNPEHDTTWILTELKKKLIAKHNETFWIKAINKGRYNNEEFHYVEAEHTMNPYISKFETLIETGIMIVEYSIISKASGKAKDKGYNFKLKPNHLNSLFPEPIKYNLQA